MSSLKNMQRELINAIEGAVNKQMMKTFGEEGVEIIKKRTLRGTGLTDSEEGKAERFPSHKPNTITRRKLHKKKGELSSDTSVRKSNLTKTGQMLQSTVSRASNGSFTIELGSRKDKNKAIALLQDGRVFIGFTKNEINKLRKKIKEKMSQNLDRVRLIITD